MNRWIEDEDYYLTDEGWVVMTEKYLLARGYCCKNNCRHCPYKNSEEKNGEENNDLNKNTNPANSEEK